MSPNPVEEAGSSDQRFLYLFQEIDFKVMPPPNMCFPRLFVFLVLLCPGPGLAAPSKTIDLAGLPPGMTITRVFGHGVRNGGTLGVPVCGGHDCDGDGFADYAFAQFQNEPMARRVKAGEVTFIFGDGSIGRTVNGAQDQAGILRIAGAQAYEAAGSEVWMDDLTGDGLGDLIVGRQNYSLVLEPPLLPRAGAGAVTLMIGGTGFRTQAATLQAFDLMDPPEGIQTITLVGPSTYDRLGIWFRTGDLTGDGIADLVVGADEVDGEGEEISHNQGAVFVIRGGSHLLEAPSVIDLALLGDEEMPAALQGHVARIDAPANHADAHLGATVQVGDLDGNGKSEVIMAATLARAGAGLRLPGAPVGTGQSWGGTRDGTVFIVWDESFPPGLWPRGYRFAADSPPTGDATVIDGDAVADTFGEEILAGLDYSGDGFADLMIGDLLGNPRGRRDAGRAYVFYNAGNLRGLSFDLDDPPEGVALSIIDGPVPGAISADTALHGDFDGDGIGDLALGNPHDTFDGRAEAGSVHVLYGQPGGWPEEIDLHPVALPPPSTMRIALIQGAQGDAGGDNGDTLCYSAAPGDVDGDGKDDLMMNEMAGNGFGGLPEDIGNLLVISGADLLGAPESAVAFDREQLDLGTLLIAGAPRSQVVSLRNISKEPVGVRSMRLIGPGAAAFEVRSDTGETVLSGGQRRSLTIVFDPNQVGRWGAALEVQIDEDVHPHLLSLRGRGVNEFMATSSIRVDRQGSDLVVRTESQFGSDYTLSKRNVRGTFDPLLVLPGNGRMLYLRDHRALEESPSALYRVEVVRP